MDAAGTSSEEGRHYTCLVSYQKRGVPGYDSFFSTCSWRSPETRRTLSFDDLNAIMAEFGNRSPQRRPSQRRPQPRVLPLLRLQSGRLPEGCYRKRRDKIAIAKTRYVEIEDSIRTPDPAASWRTPGPAGRTASRRPPARNDVRAVSEVVFGGGVECTRRAFPRHRAGAPRATGGIGQGEDLASEPPRPAPRRGCACGHGHGLPVWQALNFSA